MTTILGNACLILAALVSSQMISSTLHYKAPHGGDGGAAAFPIWMLLVHVAFLCLMAVAAVFIAKKGGFDWISSNKWILFPLVTSGLLLAVILSMISTLAITGIGGVSAMLESLLWYAYIAVPVILVASGFILLNDFLRDLVPVFCYKWPLILVFAVGLFVFGTGLYEWLRPEAQLAIQQRYENSAAIKESSLQEIENADVDSDLVRILEYTGAIYPPEVQEKAVAKIKSAPNWQKTLIPLLEDERCFGVFDFLAATDVPDKQLFLQPVKKGISTAAYWIRYRFQGAGPSGIRPDSYLNEVNSVLAAVKKFEGMGVDFSPQLREVRAVFEEPMYGEVRKFDAINAIDNWLSKH